MSTTAFVEPSFNPTPRVELTTAITDATALRVSRQYNDRTEIVRGWARRVTTMPTVVIDYEAPLETPVSYLVEGLNATGSVVGSDVTASVVVPYSGGDNRLAILQNPYVPQQSRPIQLEGNAVSTLSYRRAAAFVTPLAGGGRVGIGGPLSDPGEIPFSILTATGDEAQALLTMLSDAWPLLVRSVPPIELPRVCYVGIADVQRKFIDRDAAGWELWSITAEQLRAPSATFVVPSHTWQEVIDAYATWGELVANKATWGDVIRDPAPGV